MGMKELNREYTVTMPGALWAETIASLRTQLLLDDIGTQKFDNDLDRQRVKSAHDELCRQTETESEEL